MDAGASGLAEGSGKQGQGLETYQPWMRNTSAVVCVYMCVMCVVCVYMCAVYVCVVCCVCVLHVSVCAACVCVCRVLPSCVF